MSSLFLVTSIVFWACSSLWPCFGTPALQAAMPSQKILNGGIFARKHFFAKNVTWPDGHRPRKPAVGDKTVGHFNHSGQTGVKLNRNRSWRAPFEPPQKKRTHNNQIITKTEPTKTILTIQTQSSEPRGTNNNNN